jgi:cbb3-type cytochrome oxidase subunit 1
MNVSRLFLIIAVVYLIIGMVLGMMMGSSGDYAQRTTHAHINLVGFVSMAIFAVVYRLWPAMQEGLLAKLHFWLYQVGTLVMVVTLYTYFGGHAAQDDLVPLFIGSELLLLTGVLLFGFGVYRHARS